MKHINNKYYMCIWFLGNDFTTVTDSHIAFLSSKFINNFEKSKWINEMREGDRVSDKTRLKTDDVTFSCIVVHMTARISIVCQHQPRPWALMHFDRVTNCLPSKCHIQFVMR